MDNNKEQSMQNWKKALILDPVLNLLFQSNLNIKDFLHEKILTMDHQQIVAIYSKLSSVRHALSKSIQKQVQTKHSQIQKSFLSKHQIQSRLKLENVGEIESLKKSLESFNNGYEIVKQGSVKLENLTKVIRFSKALEKLKINVRLLRTFMKDYLNPAQLAQNQSQSPSTSPTLRTAITQQSLNLPKVSKLLKQITQLITKNDFSGIKYYEQQKSFINNAKQTLYTIAQKQLNKTIQRYRELVGEEIFCNKSISLKQKLNECAKDIKEKLAILHSINKLRQYIPVFGKGIFTSTSQQMKLLFQQQSIGDFSSFLTHEVLPLLLTNSYILIKIQQILYESSLSQHLQSTYNLPNLFMKYVQHLVSYWRNLINWNMEQDVKEMEKRRMHDGKGKIGEMAWEEKEMGEIMASVSLSTQNINSNKNKSSLSPSLIKYKIPLWYKYPTLYSSLSLLVNKLHEQVLLYADYNSKKYEFSQKKQAIMSTLIPLARRFYQKINILILDDLRNKNNNNQDLNKDNTQRLKQRVDTLQWIYDRLLLKNDQNDQQQFSPQGIVILTSINEKVLQILQMYTQNQNRKDHHQLTSLLLKVIDRKQFFNKYNDLQVAIDHLKRVKKVKDVLVENQSFLLTS